MTHSDFILNKDHQHVWHPCSQMKDYEIFKPLIIERAEGNYFHLSDGRKIIDAISSWWCKSLGHSNPRLKQALLRQLDQFEHVILANTTNEAVVQLSEKLASLTNTLNKVFYASDGSCAIEIALKMSLHTRKIQGDSHRNRFIALSHSYHGETAGALSVSDLGLYRAPYESVLFQANFLSPIPYVNSRQDALWTNCNDHWETLLKQLEPLAKSTTAIIVEPIVQGASGMKIYSQNLLQKLRLWTQEHNIHLIADEILTGLGRTGKMLACEHANIEPDFLCLAKGLTAGWLPLSCVITSDTIYNLFYDDYESGKSFLHSHTHSGNALAVGVALETLKILEEENICEQVSKLEKTLLNSMLNIAEETGKLKNVRSIGAIVAADLIVDNPQQRTGFEVFKKAVQLGAFLRPIGNTVYWLPPLNIDQQTLHQLAKITQEAIVMSFKK